MRFKIDNIYAEGDLTFTICEEPITIYDDVVQTEQQLKTVAYGSLLLSEFIPNINSLTSDTFRFDNIHINRITIGTKDVGIAYDFSCDDFRVASDKIKEMLELNRLAKEKEVPEDQYGK